MSAPVIITVGPTGGATSREMNPNLPINPDEIADHVVAAHAKGAAVCSLHFRTPDGVPTADQGIVRDTMQQIKDRCDILIQLSTGVGLDTPYEDRLALLDLQPQMVTFSTCTMSFGEFEFRNPPPFVRELAAGIRDRGIKAEVELYDHGHLDAAMALADQGLLAEPFQFGLVMGVRGGMAATPRNLVRMVDALPAGSVWQAIAIGKDNFPLGAMAMAMGGNVRTGLEDNVYIERGVLAPDNATMVAKMAHIAEALDRRPATPQEAAQALGLQPA